MRIIRVSNLLADCIWQKYRELAEKPVNTPYLIGLILQPHRLIFTMLRCTNRNKVAAYRGSICENIRKMGF